MLSLFIETCKDEMSIVSASAHGQIVCKLYYADFLFRTGNDVQGGKVYDSCIRQYITDSDMVANGETFRMWMNSLA